MRIKRRGKLFVVVSGISDLFKSYDFEECKKYIEENGSFYKSSKKLKEH